MTLLIRVDPGIPLSAARASASAELDADRGPGFTPFEKEIIAEYRRRFADYERKLDSLRPRSGGLLQGDYPVLYPSLPNPDRAETAAADPMPPLELNAVPVDGSLLGNLCFIYTVHGWPGIEATQQAMLDILIQAARLGQTGGPVSVEQHAAQFFAFTRNLLARLIRHELTDLEARAATRVAAGIIESRAKLDEAWKRLGVELRAMHRSKGAPTYSFVFTNSELSEAIHRQLVEIAEKMAVLGTLLSQQRYLPGVETIKQNVEITARIIASLRKGEIFTKQCPLALLGLTLVGRYTSRQDMEHRLGSVFATLHGALTELAGKPMGKRIEQVSLPGMEGKEGLDLTGGPERAIVRTAAARVGKDRAWLPMLHEPTWDALIQSGDLPPGGFGWVVAQHYRNALIKRRIASEVDAAIRHKLMGGVQWVAAALSILGLILAPFGGVAIIAAATAEISAHAAAVSLAVIVSQVVEMVDEMEASGLALDIGLTGPDPLAAKHLAELGARARFLHEMTGDIVEQISEQALIELVGKSLPLVKLAWVGYNYCLDLQTLLGPQDDEPAAP